MNSNLARIDLELERSRPLQRRAERDPSRPAALFTGIRRYNTFEIYPEKENLAWDVMRKPNDRGR
jgi:hypothetical protein